MWMWSSKNLKYIFICKLLHPLSKYFKTSIGIDVSEEQIKKAKSKISENNENIFVYQSNAYDITSLLNENNLITDENEKNYVDLITIGQAFHWFEEDKILSLCKNILKENGCLIIAGYDKEHFYSGHPLLGIYEELIKQLIPFYDVDVEKFNSTFSICEEKFKSYFNFHEKKLYLEKLQIPITSLFNFLKSWGSYTQMIKYYSGDSSFVDPLEIFKNKCQLILGYTSGQENLYYIDFEIPYFLIILKN